MICFVFTHDVTLRKNHAILDRQKFEKKHAIAITDRQNNTIHKVYYGIISVDCGNSCAYRKVENMLKRVRLVRRSSLWVDK